MDVNEGEKEFFKMWNDHLTDSPCLGDLHMEITVTKFIDSYGEQLFKKSLYRNFVLHVTNLSEFNLLTRPAVFAAICRLQNVFATMPKPERTEPSKINEVAVEARDARVEQDDVDDDEDCASGDEVASEDDSSEVNFCLRLSDDDDDVVVLESDDDDVVVLEDDSDVMICEKSESGSSASSDSSPPAGNNNNNNNVIKKNLPHPAKGDRFRQFVASQTTAGPPANHVVNQNDTATRCLIM